MLVRLSTVTALLAALACSAPAARHQPARTAGTADEDPAPAPAVPPVVAPPKTTPAQNVPAPATSAPVPSDRPTPDAAASAGRPDAMAATDATHADDAGIPLMSAGCGSKAAPPDGRRSLTVAGTAQSYYVHAPKGYDANKPYPLFFMFHGSTHSGADYEGTGPTSGLFGEGIRYTIGAEAIVVFPNATPKNGVTQFDYTDHKVFDAILAEVRGLLCVDNRRVFLAGHSSGAYFANELGCFRGDQIRGIAPAEGALGFAPATTTCKGSPAAFVMHGMLDKVNPFMNGVEASKFWATHDGCNYAMTMPVSPRPCVAYAGCMPGSPVVWCAHSETAYAGTGHGWPSFATQGLWAFFKSLPLR